MLTFPVAVQINGEIRCIQHIEKDELFRMQAVYCGTDREYSGYEIYADMGNCRLYAADAW